MKNWKKIILTIGILGILTAGSVVLYVYFKPHRDVATEKGVALTAQQLFDAFKANETDANAKYLDKAIELSGEVADITTNQDGNTVVNFKTNDPLFVINCTFNLFVCPFIVLKINVHDPINKPDLINRLLNTCILFLLNNYFVTSICLFYRWHYGLSAAADRTLVQLFFMAALTFEFE